MVRAGIPEVPGGQRLEGGIQQGNGGADRIDVHGMPGGGFYDPEWSTAVFTNDKVESLLLMDVTDDCIRMLYLKLDEKDLKAVTRHLRALVDKALSDEEHSGGLSLRFVQTFFNPIIALTGNERYIRHLGRELHGVRLL